VGAVILTPGFEEFDPKFKPEYGYGRFPNVITSIEFERTLSASGPSKGRVERPSDRTIPTRVAWISCVGSRDISCGNNYCSSVCCMYSIKEAVIAKEHQPIVEPTIFYMDLRAYGKGFDLYYERAQEEYGVRFIRSRVGVIEEVIGSQNLLIKYEAEGGELKKEEFNLVILSVGIEAPKQARELAEILGIELNDYGFCSTDEFSPLVTSKPGVFVCGAFQGPKDIPETVTQASGAAALASGLLASERGTMVTEKEYPPPIDIRAMGPRIGAFICHCGINIGGYVDVHAVVEYAKTLPGVVYAESNLFTCSQDTQEKIKAMIKEHNLNRVVVASCTPRTHEPLFQKTIQEAGLNPYLFEMANIRDQCSWVHMHEPEAATQKAKDLVRMAVAKARPLEPLEEFTFDLIHRGLVIGGGLAGMTAALGLAQQGFEVYLVERANELGGNLRKLYYTLEGNNPQECLKTLIERIESSPLIHTFTDAKIKDISGFVGNFKTTIESEFRSQNSEVRNKGNKNLASNICHLTSVELEHGVVIVATGGQEYKPEEYLYGKDPRVITQLELEERLADHRSPQPKADPPLAEITDYRTVVMIQCVGSREDERPYCSRVCCSEAIKNSLKLKEINPKVDIFVLYRDIRTYGFREIYFKKAREEGIIFIRYNQESKPEVIKKNGKLNVTIVDPVLKERLLIQADLLVLSVATIPRPDNEDYAKMLKVSLNNEGFFLEAHAKLRPVDFATDGVFMCGMCHSPKFIDETISQSNAAVARACTVLSKDKIASEGRIAQVDKTKCSACGMCEFVCAYKAVEIVEEETRAGKVRYAQVREALCKGCGACAAGCRSSAIDIRGFTNDAILAGIGAF
jgi:heterodisulfide reductase subunit A